MFLFLGILAILAGIACVISAGYIAVWARRDPTGYAAFAASIQPTVALTGTWLTVFGQILGQLIRGVITAFLWILQRVVDVVTGIGRVLGGFIAPGNVSGTAVLIGLGVIAWVVYAIVNGVPILPHITLWK